MNKNVNLWKINKLMWLCLHIWIHNYISYQNDMTSSYYHAKINCYFFSLTLPFIFVDSNKECFIKCFVDSRPSYEKMSSWKHKLKKMMINFVSTTHRRSEVLKKRCLTSIFSTNMEINITCKRQEKQSRY